MISVRKIKVAIFIDPGQAHPTKSQIKPQIQQIKYMSCYKPPLSHSALLQA